MPYDFLEMPNNNNDNAFCDIVHRSVPLALVRSYTSLSAEITAYDVGKKPGLLCNDDGNNAAKVLCVDVCLALRSGSHPFGHPMSISLAALYTTRRANAVNVRTPEPKHFTKAYILNTQSQMDISFILHEVAVFLIIILLLYYNNGQREK